MSIQFTSNHPEISDVLIIGGKDSVFTGNEKGGYGPFPTYSISREEISAADGTYLSSKYTININGQATIKPTDTSSALIAGQRQSRVAGEDIIKLQFNRNKFPMLGNGILEINTYTGTTTNQIKFNDARLISVDIPEKSEESAGIHYSEYSFTFEAYDLQDDLNPTTTDEFFVSSVEESWDLSLNEGQFAYRSTIEPSDPEIYKPQIDKQNFLCKTYTLTHNLSAVGFRKYVSSPALDADGEPWRQAAKWIESRIQTPENNGITSHINNKESGPKFWPLYMNSYAASGDLKIDLLNTVVDEGFSGPYSAYNLQRNTSVDIAGGGYDLTDTWILAPQNSKALHTISCDIQSDQASSSNTITVNGTVFGLDTNNTVNPSGTKYFNAKQDYESFINTNKPFNIASGTYVELNDFFKRKELDSNNQRINIYPNITPVKKTTAHNKTTGEINWSFSYNDEKFLFGSTNLISENLTINHNNFPQHHPNPRTPSNDFDARVIKIIPVLGRPEGPVIQTFEQKNDDGSLVLDPYGMPVDTFQQRTTSINLDLVFDKNSRTDQPPTLQAENIVASGIANDPVLNPYALFKIDEFRYGKKSISGDQPVPSGVVSRSESWNKKTGVYNLSIEWVHE